jgi:two-component system cell cycle sensor histidine kinase/response regulator CckA
MVMPGLSGPDVVRQVKSHRPELKTLFVTGYAERAVLDSLESGTRILSKPFTPDTLFRVVRQVLDEDIKMCA